MAKKNNDTQLAFGENITAYEAAEVLDNLNGFIGNLEDGQTATIDASATQNIDTAGCQLIDMAILAAKKKRAQLNLVLSDSVRNAFETLGLEVEE